ncbi:GNAT family N-acetyltransferase [Microbacterium esteraromaticum]|uniref:GNAT family N-acetyltransferase n=1 Tax=Microbacterium esteraromaticum TaxID=57043 RepID=UPI003242A1F0
MDPEGVDGSSPHDAGRRQGDHRAARSQEVLIELHDGIRLRALQRSDGAAVVSAYRRNRRHLAPWDPLREEVFFSGDEQDRLIATACDDRDAGRCAPFVLTRDDDDAIVGRVNINNIVRGAFDSADLGYWMDVSLVGKGLMTRAVAEVREHASSVLGLHRLQAATLVRNTASQRVLRSNGFTLIGRAPKYLRIAGEWQDHDLFQRILVD